MYGTFNRVYRVGSLACLYSKMSMFQRLGMKEGGCAAIFVQIFRNRRADVCTNVRMSIFSYKNGKNVWVRMRVRVQKLGYRCVCCTLRKCVRCACGCGQKSTHTKGLAKLYAKVRQLRQDTI